MVANNVTINGYNDDYGETDGYQLLIMVVNDGEWWLFDMLKTKLFNSINHCQAILAITIKLLDVDHSR